MKINIKFLFFIFMIFSFLPSFCFKIGNQFIPFYIVLGIILIIAVFVLKGKSLLANFVTYYQKTPFKFLMLFTGWAFITILFSIFKAKFFIGGFVNSTIGGLIASVFIPTMLILFFVPKYVKIKTIFSFIFIFSFFIFSLGLVEFIVHYLDISCLKDALSIFANKRLFLSDSDISQRVLSFGFPRIRSIFDEPSYLGYYCALISPLLYEITFNQIQIFKLKKVDYIIKKLIIPFLWLNIILTQSPIFFIFNLLFSTYYFIIVRKLYIKIIKNQIKMLCHFIFVFVLFIIFLKIDYSETYMGRVIVFFQSIKNFDTFIIAESSLATRVIIAINAFDLGMNNLFMGVGFGNMSYLIANKIANSNLPLTEELVHFVYLSKTNPASTIFVKVFSETAIIGTFLFYNFLYLLLKQIEKIKIIEKIVNLPIKGLYLFYLFFIMTSFYDSNLNQPYIWIIISTGLVLIYKGKQLKNGCLNNIC